MFNLGEISMKKSLVALAALAATGAFAQSSVTLYGVGDIWLGQTKTTVTPTGGVSTGVAQTQIGSGGVNGSRFGLKGSEDLGGGLKANFQFENGFNLDTGSFAAGTAGATQPNLFGRQAYAGLSGASWGEVRFGRQYTAYDDVRGAFDPQGHSAFSTTAGGSPNAWSAGRDYAYRVDNTMSYTSPDFSGFKAGLTLGLGENKTATASAGRMYAIKATYNNGPIGVGFAQQGEKGVIAGQNVSTTAAANDNETHTLITGSYDFGVAKLGLGYNTSKDNVAGSAGSDKEFQIGVNVPLGALELIGDFASSKSNQSAGAAGQKSTAFGLEGRYALSKRTGAYLGLRTAKGEALAPTTGAVTGVVKSNIVAVGVRHFF
jgi:predicted porin